MATRLNSEGSILTKSGFPVMTGYDAVTGKIWNLRTDTNGNLKVDLSAQSLTNLEVGTIDSVTNIVSLDLVDEITNVTSVDTVDLLSQSNMYCWDSTGAGAWNKLTLDSSTDALNTISYEHHETHQGKMYGAYRRDTLATNDTIAIAWTTPDTALEQHMEWECDVGGEVIIDIVESVTSYTGGTAQTPVNRNRRSSNTSTSTVKVGSNGALADPLVLTGGTVINERKVGSGRIQNSAGARHEWILKRNAITVLRLTAVGNNISCGLRAYWYEHTPH